MNSAWQTGIVIMAVGVGMHFLRRFQMARALRAPVRATDLPAAFRPSSAAMSLPILMTAALIAAGIGMMFSGLPGRFWIAATSLVFALLPIVLLYQYSKEVVTIDDSSVDYVSKTGGFTIPRSSIRAVYVSPSYIIIDVGEHSRRVLPLHFEDIGSILHLLKKEPIRPPQITSGSSAPLRV